MDRRNRTQRSSSGHGSRWRSIARHPQRAVLIGLCLVLLGWLSVNALALRSSSAGSVDAFLVLGGSIKREMYAAELVKQHPATPVLISRGSLDPCIKLVFERASASLEQVWLETCADSTFGNFFYATPILKHWGVHKVKLITSESHFPRALWMGQILLGAHGIWVVPEAVMEEGVPANQESWAKTGLDIARSLLWAIAGQIYQPQCEQMQLLATVDMQAWWQKGFKCEHQGNLGV